MPATSFTPHANRTSWVTGLATEPNKKCVRCKAADATEWASYQYATGRKGRLSTGFKPVCSLCSEPYCDEQNAKSAAKPARTRRDAKKSQRKARGRATAGAKPIRSLEEQAICDKYPDRTIKPGSWLPSGGRAETHGKKATVILVCSCGAERVVATSDLFQVRYCVQCGKDSKKNKADKRKLAKK